jgi:phenylacetaldehyde dehydrogenase
VVNVIPGYGETAGGALAAHPDVDKIGWGREMGHEVLEAYTEVKAVTTQL